MYFLLLFVFHVSIMILFKSLLYPFLATMSFTVYILVRFLLSVSYPFSIFSNHVPGLIWFGFVYLVATAGSVADQLV